MRKRKSLLALIGIVVLLVSLSVPMMQCAPAAEEEVTPPPEEEGIVPPPEEEEIKYGGRLNIGFSVGLPSLAQNYLTMLYTMSGGVLDLILYDNWATFNRPPDYYEWSPKLVQSYETSEDGLSWTLHLVEGATWHDGVPVTAEDVKFTCDYLLSLPGWTSVDYCVDHVEIIDDYTVKVVNAVAPATTHVPAWWSWNPVLPKHIFEPYKDNMQSYANEEGIGSGPFKLKEFKADEYLWLVANEDYWGERPYIDEVVFKYYSTLETMLTALEKGEIDVLGETSLPPALAEDFEANPDVKVEVVQGLDFHDITFNLHKDTPLQDRSVREAIAYGIDRQRIVDMIYMGYAAEHDSWAYEESTMHNPDLTQYDYDLDKANEILDGAGYIDTDEDGIRNDPATGENLAFELLCAAEYTDEVKTGTLIKEMLLDIGVHIDLATMDLDTFYGRVYDPTSDTYEMAVLYNDPGPDPYGDWIWQGALGWGSGGDWANPTYYDNPRFNELATLLCEATSLEERKEYMYEMQEIMADDLPYVFLVRGEWISAYRTDKFEGWVNEMGGPVSWFNPWSILKVHLK